MGNNQSADPNEQMLDDHQNLAKLLESDNKKFNLVFFNPPITFEYYRQSKSYFQQILGMNNSDFDCTNYNELYIGELGIKITDDAKVSELNVDDFCDFKQYLTWQFYTDDKQYMHVFKHFNYEQIDNPETNSEELNEIKESLNKIKEYEDQIQELHCKISNEKVKIRKSKYVESRINKKMSNIDGYIDFIKYISEKYLNGHC